MSFVRVQLNGYEDPLRIFGAAFRYVPEAPMFEMDSKGRVLFCGYYDAEREEGNLVDSNGDGSAYVTDLNGNRAMECFVFTEE